MLWKIFETCIAIGPTLKDSLDSGNQENPRET